MNILNDKQIVDVLSVLHEKASADQVRRNEERRMAREHGLPVQHGWATAYSAVGADEGHFLYFLAMVGGARKIVEFGCSFGISTIYLAAAAKNNDGKVITSDFEPNKVAGAQQNIQAAGLQDYVTILEGDARETLSTVEGPIDFLFLDGDKELYLPVFKMLYPKLAPNAIVVADNADQPGCRPYIEWMQQATDEFISVPLFDGRALFSYRPSNE